MIEPFKRMSDPERSAKLLEYRHTLWENLKEHGLEAAVSKVDFGMQSGTLSWVVQVTTAQARLSVNEHVPTWEGLPVVVYLPDDRHTTTVTKHKLRHIYKLAHHKDSLFEIRTILNELIESCT